MRNIFLYLIVGLFSKIVMAQPSSEVLLQQLNGSELSSLTESGSPEWFKLKDRKSDKWNIYQLMEVYDSGEITYKTVLWNDRPFDSIGNREGNVPFVVVKQKMKYGLIFLPEWDQPSEFKDISCIYDRIVVKENYNGTFVLVRKKNAWGLLDWESNLIPLELMYQDPNEIPLEKWDRWTYAIVKSARASLKVDIVEFDAGNGDGVFRARDKETGLWGMFQSMSPGEIKEMIPMQYEKVDFFPWNDPYTAVYNDGKVGFYLSGWVFDDQAKQSIPCIYDEYQRYVVQDGTPYLAVKRDGKWGWVDWLYGEEIAPFSYDTKEALPGPHFRQELYFED